MGAMARGLASAVLWLLLPAIVAAADHAVEITNDTGYTVVRLEVSPAASDSWEEDLLGKAPFPSGTTRRVTLSGYASPLFDIRLTDVDGDTYSFFGVDVSARDLHVTLDDIDAAAAGASADGSPDYYVDVTNATGYTILRLFVSPASAEDWEEDVLGADVLPHGATHRISLFGYDDPVFDVRAMDEDGDSYTFYGVNVALADVTITLDDLDARGEPDYYVDVFNATGYTMIHLQVSPTASAEWEEDVLGADVLPTGESRRVNLHGYDEPTFDVRLTDEDGDTYSFFGVDVSVQDVTVTLDDLD